MAKLTPKKIKDIRSEYLKNPNYTRVGKKCGVDWRTVKEVVKDIDGESEQDIVKKDNDQTGKGQSQRNNPILIPTEGEKAAMAYTLFSKGFEDLDVAIKMKITAEEAIKYHRGYLELCDRGESHGVYAEDREYFISLVDLHRGLMLANMTPAEFLEERKFIPQLKSIREDIIREKQNLHEVQTQVRKIFDSGCIEYKNLQELKVQVKEEQSRLEDLQKRAVEVNTSLIARQRRATELESDEQITQKRIARLKQSAKMEDDYVDLKMIANIVRHNYKVFDDKEISQIPMYVLMKVYCRHPFAFELIKAEPSMTAESGYNEENKKSFSKYIESIRQYIMNELFEEYNRIAAGNAEVVIVNRLESSNKNIHSTPSQN